MRTVDLYGEFLLALKRTSILDLHSGCGSALQYAPIHDRRFEFTKIQTNVFTRSLGQNSWAGDISVVGRKECMILFLSEALYYFKRKAEPKLMTA